MIPLEISYACPEIMGNHDRNHWKSGFTSEITISHRILLKHMSNFKYKLNICKILKYIYKYDMISLIIDDLQTCNSILSRFGFVFKM